MKFHIEINENLCKGCELCVPECAKEVIVMSDSFNSKGWRFAVPAKNELCIGCKKCAMVCPDVAIKVIRED